MHCVGTDTFYEKYSFLEKKPSGRHTFVKYPTPIRGKTCINLQIIFIKVWTLSEKVNHWCILLYIFKLVKRKQNDIAMVLNTNDEKTNSSRTTTMNTKDLETRTLSKSGLLEPLV